MKLTQKQLKAVMPNCRYPEEWVRPLSQAFEKFDIDNVQRVAAFLGQIAVESGQMSRLQENMNYRARRIQEVWPSRFASIQDALPYARNPEKLANKVYANRMGNGAERTGDGYRYRGRGVMQITGRDNYAQMAKLIDVPGLLDKPDYLLEQRYAALSAAAFWQSRGLNEAADELSDDGLEEVVTAITKRVNGGTHGLKERIQFTEDALFTLDDAFNV